MRYNDTEAECSRKPFVLSISLARLIQLLILGRIRLFQSSMALLRISSCTPSLRLRSSSSLSDARYYASRRERAAFSRSSKFFYIGFPSQIADAVCQLALEFDAVRAVLGHGLPCFES